MKAKYSSLEIAKWFINEIHPEPLKLQKLLYLVQGYSYAFYDRPLFDEETLEVLNYVKDNYSKYDSKFLEEMTHNQEPWLLSREGLDPDERSDKTIYKQNIANYFINSIFQPDVIEWGK